MEAVVSLPVASPPPATPWAWRAPLSIATARVELGQWLRHLPDLARPAR
jgi:hypothetical protein